MSLPGPRPCLQVHKGQKALKGHSPQIRRTIERFRDRLAVDHIVSDKTAADECPPKHVAIGLVNFCHETVDAALGSSVDDLRRKAIDERGARDGPIPTIMWAYPREYKSKGSAGQVQTQGKCSYRASPGQVSSSYRALPGQMLIRGFTRAGLRGWEAGW